MPDVTLAKQTKPERAPLDRYFKFETPLLRGSLFGLNPFALMRQFTEDMDRMLTPAAGTTTGYAFAPVIELKEKEGKLLVTAELPGLKPEEVKVHLDGDTLIVEGERKQEKEEKREGYFHTERAYGKFYRSILLPEGVKPEMIAANFTNGILEITIPVAEVKKTTKEIPIKAGTAEVTKKAA